MDLEFKDLKPGDSAEIIGYIDSSKGYRSKLVSMGLTPGVVVELVKVAPLGDPLEIQLRGYNLSLRKEEASVVKLRKI